VSTPRLYETMIILESRIMIGIIVFNLSRSVKSMNLSTREKNRIKSRVY
jgi:hypothetical protein